MRGANVVMVACAGLVGGLASGVATLLLAATVAPAPVAPHAGESAATRARLAAIDERLARLEARIEGIARPAPVREQVDPGPRLPTVGDGVPSSSAALDPRRLLAEYVASFADGRSGSDFFRMAVAAYAWPLRRELQEIAADRSAPELLRLQVMQMFDGGSFRGDAATIDTLLGILRDGGFEQGMQTALELLAKIGDRRTGELIEAVATGLEPLRMRAAAWDALVKLCGADAESVLLRLLERESSGAAQAELLKRFRGIDERATLRALELASRLAEVGARMVGAEAIARQRGEPFVALAQDWHGRESDEGVKARLAMALDQQKQIPSWHELQATGGPNVARIDSDDGHAWAAAAADGGREWIELGWAQARRADRVTIHETCVAGCVVEVALQDESGSWRTVFSGDDPTERPGPFVVRFPATAGRVNRVRIVVDTKRRSGWNEIDAVELSGPDGAAWADQAKASSRYGQGSTLGDFGDEFGNDFFRGMKRTRGQ